MTKTKRTLDDLHTVDETARALRVHAHSVRSYLKKCGPAVKRAGSPVVRPSDVRAWLTETAAARRIFNEAMDVSDEE